MARLITKKSTVAGKVPISTDLEIGELAVNTADAKLYTKHSSGNIVDLSSPSISNISDWPVAVDATEVGYLNGVTSSIQLQLDSKQTQLVSGTNIKSINSASLLGSGDITLFSGGLIKIEKVISLPGSPDPNNTIHCYGLI